ncbi:hypothetical protein QUC31_013205 [Theobroma cacao]
MQTTNSGHNRSFHHYYPGGEPQPFDQQLCRTISIFHLNKAPCRIFQDKPLFRWPSFVMEDSDRTKWCSTGCLACIPQAPIHSLLAAMVSRCFNTDFTVIRLRPQMFLSLSLGEGRVLASYRSELPLCSLDFMAYLAPICTYCFPK